MNDYYSINAKPELTEPGVKLFLTQTLQQCHLAKSNFYNTIFNLGMLIAFLLLMGLILLYKYKGRLSEDEKEMKNKEKKEYILSKIKNLQEAKRKAHQELITGLPNWENDYDNNTIDNGKIR